MIAIRASEPSNFQLHWVTLALALLASLAGPLARAQPCGRWVDGPDRGIAGVVGTVFDLLVCDPDADGPMPTMLVVAGDFQIAGDLESRFVAGWDGTRWIQMGTGLQYGVAYALAMHQGRLYVAGSFSGSALSNVAWWDGTRWQFVTPGPIGDVHAMRSFHDELVVGGSITGVPPSLATRGILAWNGIAWHAVGQGVDANVTSLAQYDGALIVGGDFSLAGGQPIAGVARWDGSRWSSLGNSGISPAASGVAIVRSVQALGHRLFIGGEFAGVGGTPAVGLAQWDGQSWSDPTGSYWNVSGLSAVENGIVISDTSSTHMWDGTVLQDFAPIGKAYRTATFQGSLYIAGDFRVADGAWRWGVARQSGDDWSPLSSGIDNPILAMLNVDDRVIAAGQFTHMGGISAGHIAAWNGSRWSALDEGFDAPVHTLTTFRGQLVAGGEFLSSGEFPCDHLATWDGMQWVPTVDAPVPGTVVAAMEYHALLVFAVQFPATRTDPAYFSVFTSDGSGLTPISPESVGTIATFFLHDGRLLVGGNFASIGGAAVRNLAAWDGESWGGVDLWQRGPVLSMAHFEGDLVVGTSYRDGVWRLGSRSHIWTVIGHGLSGAPTSLVEYHGRLLAIGGFHLADNQVADGLAAWDGTRWTPFQLGLARQRGFSTANGVLVYHDEVLVGGAFDHVDNLVSVNWARWKECPADLDDGSGTGVCDWGVSIDDLFYYLDLFGAGDRRADIADASGELGSDGQVTTEDLSLFLRRFVDGC